MLFEVEPQKETKEKVKMNITRTLRNAALIAALSIGGSALAADDYTRYRVLNDASTRYTLTNDDTSLSLSGLSVLRWQYNDTDGQGTEDEFVVPYTRLIVSGERQGVEYTVSGEWRDAQQGGNFDLVDAFIDFEFAGFDFRAGQFVPRFFEGYTPSPLDNVTGEYSLVAMTYGQGRTQGIEASRTFGDVFTLTGSYTDGFDIFTRPVANLGNQGADSTFAVAGEFAIDEHLSFNGAWSVTDRNNVNFDSYSFGVSFVNDTFDASIYYVSSDEYGAFADNYGIVSTLAWNASDRCTPFARYEHGRAGGASTELDVLTVGANYDIANGVVFTTSVGYSFNEISANWNTTQTGWNVSNNDSQLLLTTQLSFSF